MSKIKVMIVDDHTLFIQGLTSMLSDNLEIEITQTAETGQSAIEQALSAQPDVVLLDIGLPDLSGIEVCEKLVSGNSQLKIIALTMHDESSFITQVISKGAVGYLLKNTKREQLIEAIKSVYNGETYFSKEVTDVLLHKLTSPSKQDNLKISRREKEVLELIVYEHTTNEIAEKLFISLNTVESHRANLLAKLEVKNTAGLVRVALEKGLLKIG